MVCLPVSVTVPESLRVSPQILTASTCVVLPSYNEGEAILTLVWEIQSALQGKPYEILVVDDGSSDDSMAVLESAQLDGVTILRHPENRGLGEAIRTGLTEALERVSHDHDVIVVMDADCTHTPHLIHRMLSSIHEGNDVVIASRYRYGAAVIGLSLFRLFLSHASSWVFRLCQPIANVRDYTCGYRAYRAGLLRRAFDQYQQDFVSESGFACMVDILIKLSRMGAIVTEVPLVLRYDKKVSTSKMKVAKTIVNSLALIVRQWGQR